MSSEWIITHCAPTLAGIKTANLFNEYFKDKASLLLDIQRFNRSFKDKGIKMIPIAIKDNRALIYCFRVKDLKHDFSDTKLKSLLKKYGYDADDIYLSLTKLSQKIASPDKFPHEIGLFLGYPVEDVEGFINNNGQNYKSIGYWKVYGNLAKANETFHKYQTCQKILLDRLNMGYTLKQLVIQK